MEYYVQKKRVLNWRVWEILEEFGTEKNIIGEHPPYYPHLAPVERPGCSEQNTKDDDE